MERGMNDRDGFYILAAGTAGTGSFLWLSGSVRNMVKKATNIERAFSSRLFSLITRPGHGSAAIGGRAILRERARTLRHAVSFQRD
jgi:hypothetical protein